MHVQTRRKVSFILMLIAAPALAIGTRMSSEPASAAVTVTPASVYTTNTRLAHAEQRIKNLEQRRAYLHRYIQRMRAELNAPDPVTTTTPDAPSTSVPSTGTITATSSSNGWADELAAAGFPSDAIPTMLGYIERESGGDPSAVNSSSGACGLLQLYPCYGGSAWLDPMTNLRLAHQKYEASGFAPWGG
jgi:hypothetical protein